MTDPEVHVIHKYPIRVTVVIAGCGQVVLKAVNQPEALQRELQLHSRVRDINVMTLWGTTTLLTGEQALVLEHCEKGDLRRCLAQRLTGLVSGAAAQPLPRCGMGCACTALGSDGGRC